MAGPTPLQAPVAGDRSALTYEPYYGLREKAFSLSPDPRFLYKSRTHAPIFDDLLAGIRRREGLIVLTGDIGTGKTTLCRAVLEQLDRKTLTTFVSDPYVSREDLLKMILVGFGVLSLDDFRTGRLSSASRPDLSYALSVFLKSLPPVQAFAVLIIDEAQNLSGPLLEELRILSDLEAPDKLLQVVLIGQLEFRTKLKLPEMRQLNQRVSVRGELDALNRDGVAGYIAHRLTLAGGGIDRIEFPPDAIDLIFHASGGVPRLINLICDRALHWGHLSQTSGIEGNSVHRALRDLGLAEPSVTRSGVALADPEAQSGFTEKPSKQEDESRDFGFDEHDLHHAKLGGHPIAPGPIPLRGELPAAPPEPSRSLPVESEAVWQEETPREGPRWKRRMRRLVAPLVVGLVLSGASAAAVFYWQDQVQESASATLPPPPGPPALRIVPSIRPKSEPGLVSRIDDLPAAPDSVGAPKTASAGLFSIDVAMFDSAGRADRLVEQLTAAGYRARRTVLDAGDRGQLHEVLVGSYPTRSAAEADATRLRSLPGYEDAKVVGTRPQTSVPVTPELPNARQ